MNYAQYMRKIKSQQVTYIPSPSGEDASMVTMRAQARAQAARPAPTLGEVGVGVNTSFSYIGGTVANIMKVSKQNCSPTNAVCQNGYQGFSQGTNTTDKTAELIGAAQKAAVCGSGPNCSGLSSAEPYAVTIPCGIFIDPPQNAPGKIVCCEKDMGVLFTNNSELIADQGRQEALRKSFNLPSKLTGVRGGVVFGR